MLFKSCFVFCFFGCSEIHLHSLLVSNLLYCAHGRSFVLFYFFVIWVKRLLLADVVVFSFTECHCKKETFVMKTGLNSYRTCKHMAWQWTFSLVHTLTCKTSKHKYISGEEVVKNVQFLVYCVFKGQAHLLLYCGTLFDLKRSHHFGLFLFEFNLF